MDNKEILHNARSCYLQISIRNWDEYNPRKDYITRMPWFRVESDIAFSEKLFGLRPDQKWLWICLLSYAAKKVSGDVKVPLPYLSLFAGINEEDILMTLDIFQELQLLTYSTIGSRSEPIGIRPQNREENIREEKTSSTESSELDDGSSLVGEFCQEAKKKQKEDKTQDSINYIVGYLNKKSGKTYKPSSKKTQSVIKARLKDGFTEEDFEKVIDFKVEQWGSDSKMRQYIRPETLFGTKMESYIEASKDQGGPDPLKELFESHGGGTID